MIVEILVDRREILVDGVLGLFRQVGQVDHGFRV